ncbi:MAG TPA: methyltransferase domain-containing protein [Candidatus Agrococcus pullicola]|uniref:Methyltransferase domain-containing protein n=1 Tax=Candidatus Agrococcus pullicola TaxID=2838429 RepID=A0A9D1YUS6_9MICO|nr:methyltransferase domain-containing protein [Candidatus Agrococcus pullicola]
MPDFDKTYWEEHWAPTPANAERDLPVHPYLPTETSQLSGGTALDAGCGTGAEAVWLAEQGWLVTGADISATALEAAGHRAERAGLGDRIEWVETDLTQWEPGRSWDLVVTSYAHSEIGQLLLYRQLASLVAPSGTLLIVGHLHEPGTNGGSSTHGDPGHHGAHPEAASVTRDAITQMFDVPGWAIDASYENVRAVRPGGRPVQLRDVVVRAHRNG